MWLWSLARLLSPCWKCDLLKMIANILSNKYFTLLFNPICIIIIGVSCYSIIIIIIITMISALWKFARKLYSLLSSSSSDWFVTSLQWKQVEEISFRIRMPPKANCHRQMIQWTESSLRIFSQDGCEQANGWILCENSQRRKDTKNHFERKICKRISTQRSRLEGIAVHCGDRRNNLWVCL